MILKEAIYFTAVHDFSAVILLQSFIGNSSVISLPIIKLSVPFISFLLSQKKHSIVMSSNWSASPLNSSIAFTTAASSPAGSCYRFSFNTFSILSVPNCSEDEFSASGTPSVKTNSLSPGPRRNVCCGNSIPFIIPAARLCLYLTSSKSPPSRQMTGGS